MTVLQEGNLRFTFDGDVRAWKFDDEAHGLSHCMKAVDFIVEFMTDISSLRLRTPNIPMRLNKAGTNSSGYSWGAN